MVQHTLCLSEYYLYYWLLVQVYKTGHISLFVFFENRSICRQFESVEAVFEVHCVYVNAILRLFVTNEDCWVNITYMLYKSWLGWCQYWILYRCQFCYVIRCDNWLTAIRHAYLPRAALFNQLKDFSVSMHLAPHLWLAIIPPHIATKMSC